MQRPVWTLFTATVLCPLLITGPLTASAQTSGNQAQVISQLEERAQRLERHAHATKGAGRQELELQRLRLKKLIERLKAGQAVDPHEIETLLRKGPQ